MLRAAELGILAAAMALGAVALAQHGEPFIEAKQHESGMAHKRAGRHEAAAADLRAAVELQPDYVDAHWALAWTHATQGEAEAAVAAFERVVELAPASPKADEARATIARLTTDVG